MAFRNRIVKMTVFQTAAAELDVLTTIVNVRPKTALEHTVALL